ncbi:MAG: DsbA family protein [Candidatus Omnitrophica bacterium]|nr:DsbA family protein [Candidatus Omnitrophota bacterium]
MKKPVRYVSVGIILAGCIVGGMLFLRHRAGVEKRPERVTVVRETPKEKPTVESVLATESVVKIKEESTAKDPYLKSQGPEDAPVQIIEYSDYQCPACRFSQGVLHGFMKQYPGAIRLIYHHFPLQGHPWSSFVHQAAECANEQGLFWVFHDYVFSHQSEWSTPLSPTQKILSYARDLGLNLDQFAACLTNEGTKRRIQKEKATGDDLKVNATPTFFVNGQRVVGGFLLKKEGEKIIRETLGLPPLDEEGKEKKEVEIKNKVVKTPATQLKLPPKNVATAKETS